MYGSSIQKILNLTLERFGRSMVSVYAYALLGNGKGDERAGVVYAVQGYDVLTGQSREIAMDLLMTALRWMLIIDQAMSMMSAARPGAT
ncbi:hypothetical protein JR064_02885 [Xanthomonas sp. CFBP 8703]|uniref:Uncharacterized protein n=1 Tax=Xanthomonas bonasiae TaxID=2810351 RepID=A0ABS3AXK2_9XANT|nr:hypothetical protein [Xanthomonas bonasiae]MBN6101108.1 hypothetical protein [Xanthomonas bonasiae]